MKRLDALQKNAKCSLLDCVQRFECKYDLKDVCKFTVQKAKKEIKRYISGTLLKKSYFRITSANEM